MNCPAWNLKKKTRRQSIKPYAEDKRNEQDEKAGSNKATISLVLGILSLICVWFGYSAIVGLVLGIVGTYFGAKARKEAQTGIATAGFVCSLIGVILCALGLLCIVACAGTIGALGLMGSLS